MIVVVYRWRLKPDYVEQFCDAWEKTTKALLEYGAMGSALFSAPDGTYYAIAKWPDAATRRHVFDHWDDGGLIEAMQCAVSERFPEIMLDEVRNLW
jgi:hypothetical protein